MPLEVTATQEEGRRFKRLAHTTTAFIGNMQPRKGQLPKPALGSGVLARIADVDFVITACHNIEGCGEDELFIAVPGDAGLMVPVCRGEYMKGFIRRDFGEPDVGIVELAPDGPWRNSEPIFIDEFASHEDVGPSDRVLVCGAPYAHVSEPEPAITSPILGAEATPTFSALMVPYTTTIAYDCPTEDFTRGRGFHVYYGASVFDDGSVALVHPEGISGGPVFAIEGGKRALLGLARSFSAPHYELCEPIWCALEFLRDSHPNPAVVSEARRGLRRLGRE